MDLGSRSEASAAGVPPERAPCAELRSKKYFFLDGPPRRAEDVADGSGHVWCARTAMAVGPDARPVDVDLCSARRACYRPHFPSLERLT